MAKLAVSRGNHPFGAILVFDDKVIATSENEVNTLCDVTAHAEIQLIKKAQKLMDKEKLSQATLYSSTEPCAMCAGAIYWSGVRKVIFGTSGKFLCDLVKGGLEISCEEIFDKGSRKIDTKACNSIEEMNDLHVSFWDT